MSGCFRGLFPGRDHTVKPFKVQDAQGNRRVGIVAKSFEDLLHKARLKFDIIGVDLWIVLLSDGTEIEDNEYFQSLPAQTELVLLTPGEQWDGWKSQLETALNHFLQEQQAAKDAIDKWLMEEESHEMMTLVGHLASTLTMNIDAETRQQDPAWFKDVPARFHNKNDYMSYKAKTRISKYLDVAQDFIRKKSKGRFQQHLFDIIEDFRNELRHHDYNSSYFSRWELDPNLRMCDSDGWFICEGSFDVSECEYSDHRINPYANYENRILFRTWDLDHGIEKSREVLPQLLYAARNMPQSRQLNWFYFYELLFTRRNLKLVHTVCHDKTEHTSAKCDHSEFYI